MQKKVMYLTMHEVTQLDSNKQGGVLSLLQRACKALGLSESEGISL